MNKTTILAMAFTRSRWVDKFANTFKGALGEYAKLKYAEEMKMPDTWSNEIKSLMKTIENLFNPKIIKTKAKFNLHRAAAEGFLEAMNEQKQVLDAKNEFRTYLDTAEEKRAFNKTSKDLNLQAEDLAFELLEEYLADYQDEILKEVQVKLS